MILFLENQLKENQHLMSGFERNFLESISATFAISPDELFRKVVRTRQVQELCHKNIKNDGSHYIDNPYEKTKRFLQYTGLATLTLGAGLLFWEI